VGPWAAEAAPKSAGAQNSADPSRSRSTW
jgi:hypothetical protein